MEQPSGLVASSQVESAADVTSLARGDGVQTRGGGGGGRKFIEVARTVLQGYLDVFLGAVLVLAGALKGHQLLTDPSAARTSGFPRELLIAAAAFELAFGYWLLAGLYRRLTHWLALAWFTSLAAVALAEAVDGAPSCACLGKLHAHPWLMCALDIAAVATLWIWSPNNYSCRRFLLIILCRSLLPATALIVLTGTSPNRTILAEIDLGEIVQGSRIQKLFQLRDENDVSMEVVDIATSCACASIQIERPGVPAGQFLTGRVTLDLRQKTNYVGNLVIQSKGFTRRGRIAFVLVIRAYVEPAAQTTMRTR